MHFSVSYAPNGQSKCRDKDCKELISKGSLRIGREVNKAEVFGGGSGTYFYHPAHFFRAQERFRPGTRHLTSTAELANWGEISSKDQHLIESLIDKSVPKKVKKQKTKKSKEAKKSSVKKTSSVKKSVATDEKKKSTRTKRSSASATIAKKSQPASVEEKIGFSINLRYVDANSNSNKFWNIQTHDKTALVHYGRVGTKGAYLTLTYPTVKKALADAHKRSQAKFKKGYFLQSL